MPRPTKALRRQKINAATAWKRGDKKEAYKLWGEASAGLKEHRAKKHRKAEPVEAEPQAEAAETPTP